MAEAESPKADPLLEGIAVFDVEPGTSFGDTNDLLFVANNRSRKVRFLVYEYVPPPPPPTCGEGIWINGDEYFVADCELEPGHKGSHRGETGNWVVEYYPLSDNG